MYKQLFICYHRYGRARLRQIMNLLWLAPKIQEEILGLEGSENIRRITERGLRRISLTMV